MSATVSHEPATGQEAPVAPALLGGEKLLSPAAAAKASRIPGHRGAATINGATIFRHITRGVRTPNGTVIRLEAIRIGCRWLTSLEAIARFGAALTAANLPTDDDKKPEPATPAARKRDAARASAELAELLG